MSSSFLERVRAALQTGVDIERREYIDALEEIACEVEARLAAAREDEERENNARDTWVV